MNIDLPKASSSPNIAKPEHEKLELDLERYELEMKDELYLQRVRGHVEGGNRSGVRATPTFFIDGKIQDVSFGLDSLVNGVEAALRETS